MPSDIADTMTDRPHNVASEFARAVLASGPRRHLQKLEENKYQTPFERAVRLLWLEEYDRELIRNWRRGKAKPRSWAIQLMRDELERCGELFYAVAEELRHEVGPGQGPHGTEALRRYHAMRRAEKEKGAEAPSTGTRNP